MNKYNGLLSNISRQYHILKGNTETETEWKTRLIYSICGMMAYASLWDDAEKPVSIAHLRKRIRSIFQSYLSLYPELSQNFSSNSELLEKEITNQFLCAGIVYHSPYRIVASQKHEEHFGDILFWRGIAPDSISCVSGIGFYTMRKGGSDLNRMKTMFGLSRDNLQTLWQNTISSAVWKSAPSFEFKTEYLRMNPPFTYGYWVNDPNKTGAISLLRIRAKGLKQYYLYRYGKGGLEISPLSQWQVENHNYRSQAIACLSNYGIFPPIEYFEDGPVVHVQLTYLLPPREQEFLKCYSWPETCMKLPCNFNRTLSVEVFEAIKNILSSEGYVFKVKGGTT